MDRVWGPVHAGRRVSISASEKVYRVNEEIRVDHVMEAVEPGHEIFVLGPKEVFDVYVDGELHGESYPYGQLDPFQPFEYDGRVLPSPARDANFDITTYTFPRPGVYRIQWRPGQWRSNILEVRVR